MSMLVLASWNFEMFWCLTFTTKHMSVIGKKDVQNIMENFHDRVKKLDPRHQLTDFFLFDGAFAVEIGSAVLCVTILCAMYFHCGDKVLSLF